MSKISPYSLYSALCSIHFTVGNSERVTLWSSHLSAEFNCPNRVTVMLFPRVKGLMCDKMMPSELLSGIGQRTSFERKRLRWAVISGRCLRLCESECCLCLRMRSAVSELNCRVICYALKCFGLQQWFPESLPSCIARKADNSPVHNLVKTAELRDRSKNTETLKANQ